MDRRLRWSVVAFTAALALVAAGSSQAPARERESAPSGKILKIRVYEKGSATPNVMVNIPVSVVSAFLKLAARSGAADAALKDEGVSIGGKEGVRLRGADLEALWQAIEKMEAGPIVEIQDDGERVDIRIE